jgi:hypothetical protein
MVVAGGHHQQELGHRRPAVDAAGEHEAADRFGAGRAAGLAGADGGDPRGFEARDEAGELRGLADALAALEGDEAAPRLILERPGAQERPQIR